MMMESLLTLALVFCPTVLAPTIVDGLFFSHSCRLSLFSPALVNCPTRLSTLLTSPAAQSGRSSDVLEETSTETCLFTSLTGLLRILWLSWYCQHPSVVLRNGSIN